MKKNILIWIKTIFLSITLLANISFMFAFSIGEKLKQNPNYYYSIIPVITCAGSEFMYLQMLKRPFIKKINLFITQFFNSLSKISFLLTALSSIFYLNNIINLFTISITIIGFLFARDFMRFNLYKSWNLLNLMKRGKILSGLVLMVENFSLLVIEILRLIQLYRVDINLFHVGILFVIFMLNLNILRFFFHWELMQKKKINQKSKRKKLEKPNQQLSLNIHNVDSNEKINPKNLQGSMLVLYPQENNNPPVFSKQQFDKLEQSPTHKIETLHKLETDHLIVDSPSPSNRRRRSSTTKINQSDLFKRSITANNDASPQTIIEEANLSFLLFNKNNHSIHDDLFKAGKPINNVSIDHVLEDIEKKFNNSIGNLAEYNCNSLSEKSYKIQKTPQVASLWEYLSTILDDGIAIFCNENLIQFNSPLSHFLCLILDFNELPADFNTNWTNVLLNVNLTPIECRSVETFSECPKLTNELLNMICLPIKDNQVEVRAHYYVYANNKIFDLVISKRKVLDENCYTLLKITDISEHYKALSYKATKNIKKLIGLSLSHEVKTPLNYLISSVKILKDEISLLKYNQLKNSTKLFGLALNGVLKVAFINNPKHVECLPQLFSVSDLIGKTISKIKHLFQNRGINLIVEDNMQKIECQVYHDKIIIESIIYQFLSNSLKFTKKGEVKVVLNNLEFENEFEIVFQDTGIGMDSDEQINLENFLKDDLMTSQHISKYSTGANLGLTICKVLINRIHLNSQKKERIKFYSVKNQGTSFIVQIKKNFEEIGRKPSIKSQISRKLKKLQTNISASVNPAPLPLLNLEELCEFVDDDPDSKTPAFYFTSQKKNSPKFIDYIMSNNDQICVECECPFRILVIDDEEFNISAFIMIVSALPKNSKKYFEIIPGHDGKEGLDIFFNYFKNKKCKGSLCSPIKLVVIDYNMPCCKGPDVAAKIKKYLKDKNELSEIIQMYGWTAYIGEEYKNEFIKAGCTGILTKPLKIQELSKVLAVYIKK